MRTKKKLQKNIAAKLGLVVVQLEIEKLAFDACAGADENSDVHDMHELFRLAKLEKL